MMIDLSAISDEELERQRKDECEAREKLNLLHSAIMDEFKKRETVRNVATVKEMLCSPDCNPRVQVILAVHVDLPDKGNFSPFSDVGSGSCPSGLRVRMMDLPRCCVGLDGLFLRVLPLPDQLGIEIAPVHDYDSSSWAKLLSLLPPDQGLDVLGRPIHRTPEGFLDFVQKVNDLLQPSEYNKK
jgi:hypothetical protein